MARDPKSDVLQIQLSRYHSLDLVRLPRSRKYRVVFAERFGVQRRAFVEISFEAARKVALFLASIDNQPTVEVAPEPPPVDPFSATLVEDAAVPEAMDDSGTGVVHDKPPSDE